MDEDDPKGQFGDDYPAFFGRGEHRIPLSKETRFSREYHDVRLNLYHEVSRFMDGSAKMDLETLRKGWPTWPRRMRIDFCQNCSDLSGQKDFPDMLRFIMDHSSEDEPSVIAGSVASSLPQDEAFVRLVRALDEGSYPSSANLTQAIASTGHPGAVNVLRAHLEELWEDPELWLDDEFLNWCAFDVMCCVERLIGLGEPPADFEDTMRLLAEHPCKGLRDSYCNRTLRKHYPWLPPPGPIFPRM